MSPPATPDVLARALKRARHLAEEIEDLYAWLHPLGYERWATGATVATATGPTSSVEAQVVGKQKVRELLAEVSGEVDAAYELLERASRALNRVRAVVDGSLRDEPDVHERLRARTVSKAELKALRKKQAERRARGEGRP